MEGSLGNFRTLESEIGEGKQCFRRGRGKAELMFALKQLVEKRKMALRFNSLII